MSTGTCIEGGRGSSPDFGVTVRFDQDWFDQLVLEALLVDGNIVRYRARSQDAAQSWLIAVPTDLPSEAVFRRLQQEFAPADKLDSTWAVRPVVLVRLSRGPVLVYEDTGGTLVLPPADGLIAVSRFLRIAVGAAHALRLAHTRGVLHRDLKPSNLLECSDGTFRLLGFRDAFDVAGDPLTESPDTLYGTLAYMSPEQARRAEGSADERSDLYSLGVTLYELLTGQLPFEAADAVEWVYNHVARQPADPRQHRRGCPAVLSSIVLKLLAKNPADRYQSASSIETDLRRCLADWNEMQHIVPFEPAAEDNVRNLVVTHRLFGRAREHNALLEAFERNARQGMAELIFVSGYSGAGKSELVRSAYRATAQSPALFASGKLEQYGQNAPYAPLMQAIRSLFERILGESDSELDGWREVLRDAVGIQGKLLVSYIPELELVLGTQPDVPDLPPVEAQLRFQALITRLLSVFATEAHPLILFFDDVHWFDDATLNFIACFLTTVGDRHVLLICAYRANEVDQSPRFKDFLNALPSGSARISTIEVAPLDIANVTALLADVLHCGSAHVYPLAAVVHEKTGGNPFFVKQLLLALADHQLIGYNGVAGRWTWDIDRISEYESSDNVIDLMVARLSRLPVEAQTVLKLLASMGRRFDRETLVRVDLAGGAELERRLLPAVEAGLIVSDRTGFAFAHDRVLEAAYALIAEEERGAEHARIARILLEDFDIRDVRRPMFDIAHHIERAQKAGALRELNAHETTVFSRVCLQAARHAKEAIAIQSALSYLDVAQKLLDASGEDYFRSLGYETGILRVQCHILEANFEAAGIQIEKLLNQDLSIIARASVYKLKADMQQHLSDYEAALDTALEGIKLFGTYLPRDPEAADVEAAYSRLNESLGMRTVASIADLPPMRNEAIESEMNLLASVFAPASFVNERLGFLSLCRMVQLTIDHGIAGASAPGLAWFGVYVAEFFGRYAQGFEFARLARTLVEERGYRAAATSTLVALDQVAVWTQPLSYVLECARAAFESARPSGDLTMSCYSCNHIVSDLLILGAPLEQVDKEIDLGLSFARRVRFKDVEHILELQKRFVHSLTGGPGLPGNFGFVVDGKVTFDADLLDTQMTTLRFWIWLFKGVSCYFHGDYQNARYCLAVAGELKWGTPAHIHLLDYHFYSALNLAKLSGGEEDSAAAVAMIGPHLATLRNWAQLNPATFRDKLLLVEAEVARLNGAPLEALSLYEQAAEAASENGFNHSNALAHELASVCSEANGLFSAARHHSRRAIDSYTRWGALAKAGQLERAQRPARHSLARLAASRPSVEIPDAQQQFDLVSALKSSQALSEEIVLDKLIRTLVTLAIVHAGAQSGMLILLKGNVPVVEAIGRDEPGGVQVTLGADRLTPEDVPASVFYTALRTRKPVVVEDAQSDPRFSFDVSLSNRAVRSLCCLPLVKQGNAVGVLYLENNLTAGVFTASRTSVLELLASQAAISLETARLYAELVEENKRRQETEMALRMSEEALALGQRISRSGSYIWNALTGERYWSKELYNVFGLPMEAGSPSTQTVLERIHPEDVGAYQEAVTRAAHNRTPFRQKYRIVTMEGAVKYLEVLGEPSGVSNFVGVVTDFTDRHTTELALQNAKIELAKASRATTMGELAASIAHEINQPLASIVSNASAGVRWLNRPVPDIPEALAGLRDIVKDGKRAGDIIKALQSLAKETRPSLVSIRVDDVVREVFALAAAEVEQRRLIVRLDLAAGRAVMADRVQLQQVLFNLVMNAADAMSHLDARQRLLSVTSRVSEGGAVVVSVLDNGSGIGEEIGSRIFDAFFTTKETGMGMGLAICKSIIEAHGGTLTATPGNPRGTIFVFTLPAAA
ncbi:putative ATPase [Paraburkholderia sp. BL23I1N1]|uniref:ATP-binding sensor histidine kinase n=1 Tax=Paraburkholderia sp. BL23I1N1 TaxID=1938802 RepID=UPI000FF0ECBE|nr:ATP-binding sensor histidine kinase [Paraburkholderia sp. BL23I1N1]RKE35724.1 putative ATPase [Paraburkholderia sp. BL23I1N1]